MQYSRVEKTLSTCKCFPYLYRIAQYKAKCIKNSDCIGLTWGTIQNQEVGTRFHNSFQSKSFFVPFLSSFTLHYKDIKSFKSQSDTCFKEKYT